MREREFPEIKWIYIVEAPLMQNVFHPTSFLRFLKRDLGGMQDALMQKMGVPPCRSFLTETTVLGSDSKYCKSICFIFPY